MDREFLEKHAVEHSFALSKMADKIITIINKKDGNCPCRIEKVKCPCPMHEKEVEEKGRCTCNLFVRKEKE